MGAGRTPIVLGKASSRREPDGASLGHECREQPGATGLRQRSGHAAQSGEEVDAAVGGGGCLGGGSTDAVHVEGVTEAVGALLDAVELGVGQAGVESGRLGDVPPVYVHVPDVELHQRGAERGRPEVAVVGDRRHRVVREHLLDTLGVATPRLHRIGVDIGRIAEGDAAAGEEFPLGVDEVADDVTGGPVLAG